VVVEGEGEIVAEGLARISHKKLAKGLHPCHN